jgi:hypothetical protein
MKLFQIFMALFVLHGCSRSPNATSSPDEKTPDVNTVEFTKPDASIHPEQARVYAIDEMTENSAGCDDGGASVLDKQTSKYFALKNVGNDQMGHFVYAVACRDEATCQKALTTENVGGDWIFMFSQKKSSEEFNGESVFTGILRDGQCVGPRLQLLNLQFIGDEGVVMSMKTTFGEDYAAVQKKPDLPLMCFTDIAKESLKDKPCNQHLVIRGRLPKTGESLDQQ